MDLINFTFPTEVEPDIAIEKLLKALDLQNLQFMTNQTFSEIETPPYKVDAVTMTGTPDFVKYSLKEMREKIFQYLNDYANSQESIHSKIQMLSEVEMLLTEKLFYWDIDYPELYESPLSFELIDSDSKLKDVVLHELVIPDVIKKEIIEHHNVRIAFFQLLIKYVNLLKMKINHYNANYIVDDNVNLKSVDLLEIWIGLKEMGFLEGNEKKEIKIRTDFFKLFAFQKFNIMTSIVKLKNG
jgi:hypothetical protein